MKKLVSVISAVVVLSVASLSFAAAIKGPVSKITKNDDGSYTVVVKDTASGNSVEMLISDELTINKLNSKKIVVDDDVRVKYDEKDGKNVSTRFLKAAGC